MTNTLTEAGITADDYCLFGLATCFIREEGETKQIDIIEPIPSAALEALLKGIPTSYKLAVAKNVGDIINEDKLQKPSEFPTESRFSENFVERTLAAVRTYKNKPSATKFISIGTCKDDLNYSTERKRVLNNAKTVSEDDNVKQHSHTHKKL